MSTAPSSMKKGSRAPLSGREVRAASLLAAILVLAGAASSGRPAPAVEPLELEAAAAASELTLVRGVGPVLAERIARARDAQGGFEEPADILAVDGVGPSLLPGISRHLSFPEPPTPARPATHDAGR